MLACYLPVLRPIYSPTTGPFRPIVFPLHDGGDMMKQCTKARCSGAKLEVDTCKMTDVIAALKNRRSRYALSKSLPMAQGEVDALIREAIRVAPSSFNSQSSRAIILFGAESDKFWGIVADVLRAVVPAEAFAATEAKLNSFAAGAGTVLFYEDQDVVKGLQEQFALYADNFPVWSEHSTAMAQLATWTALAEAGIGASLQHYNPIADEKVAAAFNVPASWKLRAQMPFGVAVADAAERSFIADEGRFVTLG